MRSFTILLLGMTAVGSVLSGVSAYTYYEYYGRPRCEACGMFLSPQMLAQWEIVLPNGETAHACCAGCALRLASSESYSTMRINTYDDWYGSSEKIVIDISARTIKSINPTTVKFLMGSKIVKSCANNRISVNETSVKLLLQNGYNKENSDTTYANPLPEGTPVVNASMTLEGALKTGITYSPPGVFFLTGLAGAGVAVLVVSVLFNLRTLRRPV